METENPTPEETHLYQLQHPEFGPRGSTYEMTDAQARKLNSEVPAWSKLRYKRVDPA